MKNQGLNPLAELLMDQYQAKERRLQGDIYKLRDRVLYLRALCLALGIVLAVVLALAAYK
jgi:hypothetical protein